MSFSATILFSPPGGSESRCCCCACKSEAGGGGSGPRAGSPQAGTPITVTGHGLAVQGTEQLLHAIYQRVDKAVGLAEAALGLARANHELLGRLQEELGGRRRGAEAPEAAEGRAGRAGRAPSPPPPPAEAPAPPAPPAPVKESPGEEECDSLGSGVQVVIEELRQLGAAQAGAPGGFPAPPREARPPAAPGPPLPHPLVEEYVASEGAIQRVLVPAYAKQLSPATQLAIQRASSEPGPENGSTLPAPRAEDLLSAVLEEPGPGSTGELRPAPGFTASPCRIRGSGQKNSRRKRDLVLSKLVHNVHNHITNDKRFNGSESIKSSWNISVVKFLLEKLKQELVTSPHNYTDKELKGPREETVWETVLIRTRLRRPILRCCACQTRHCLRRACVAYFLTKRREYRNSLNPFKGLKEKEEKKLRSRRYRLFANRSSIMRHFGPEDQHLWKDVTEELMSDEEDSLNEPGVWVARPPRFRAQRLTQLCYHLDANSKHGTKANRVYGPPSDRLPSAEAQLLPPELYNPNFQEEEEEEEGSHDNGPISPSFDQPHKTCCPDLNSFIEIKVERDE